MVHPFSGWRVATFVHAMVADAECIDDADAAEPVDPRRPGEPSSRAGVAARSPR